MIPGQLTPCFTKIYHEIPFLGYHDPNGSTNPGQFKLPVPASSSLTPGPSNDNDPNPRNSNDIPMTPRSQEIQNILTSLLELPYLPN